MNKFVSPWFHEPKRRFLLRLCLREALGFLAVGVALCAAMLIVSLFYGGKRGEVLRLISVLPLIVMTVVGSVQACRTFVVYYVRIRKAERERVSNE